MIPKFKRKKVGDCPKCQRGTLVLSRFRILELPYQEHKCDRCGYIHRSEDYIAKMFLVGCFGT